ncbi:MAG: acyl-CoA dehydrogenase, partial [bacterium]|nr:acyl-CoA dehydrogenase [bacterium]
LADSEPETTRYGPYPISTVATIQDRGYIINGIKLFVQDAEVADYMIVTARSIKDEIFLFIVDAKSPGISLTPLQTLGGDKQYEVIFNDVKVLEADILGDLNDGRRQLDSILQKASICKCAEMVGGGQKVLEMATEYAKERKQFGKPIGAYQAIQHHCANMLIDIESSRFITYKT